MYLGDPLLSILAFCGLSATVWQIATHLYSLSYRLAHRSLIYRYGTVCFSRPPTKPFSPRKRTQKITVTVGNELKKNSPNSTKLKATIQWRSLVPATVVSRQIWPIIIRKKLVKKWRNKQAPLFMSIKNVPFAFVLFILICEPPESFFVVQSHPLGTQFFVRLSYTVVKIKMYLIVISKVNKSKKVN